MHNCLSILFGCDSFLSVCFLIFLYCDISIYKRTTVVWHCVSRFYEFSSKQMLKLWLTMTSRCKVMKVTLGLFVDWIFVIPIVWVKVLVHKRANFWFAYEIDWSEGSGQFFYDQQYLQVYGSLQHAWDITWRGRVRSSVCSMSLQGKCCWMRCTLNIVSNRSQYGFVSSFREVFCQQRYLPEYVRLISSEFGKNTNTGVDKMM